MGNHRAHRGPRRSTSAAPVVAVPVVGKRRATTPARRSPLLRSLPSAPILLGVTALAISAGGALTASDADLAGQVTSGSTSIAAAGTMGIAQVAPTTSRDAVVSRDSRRDAQADAANQELIEAAEAQAKEQHAALEQFAQAAEKQSAKIRENQWVLPLESYRISATFGASSYLWSSVHTGLDMSASSGTAIRAIANGVITETGYDGSYGNKTVLTLEDGTELWFCHQTSIDVSVGDTVRGGEVIGTVGSTGNSTGPHLHLEVRPGGGDPVDPFTALLEHGVTP
jgi:murein DD-endopeptidase MepM/ murein hydrolase activator NlpD